MFLFPVVLFYLIVLVSLSSLFFCCVTWKLIFIETFWQERAYELSQKYKEGKYILELYVIKKLLLSTFSSEMLSLFSLLASCTSVFPICLNRLVILTARLAKCLNRLLFLTARNFSYHFFLLKCCFFLSLSIVHFSVFYMFEWTSYML